MSIRENMQPCRTIHPDTSLAEAMRELRRAGGRALVVQGDGDGFCCVLSEQDLAEAMPSGRWALRATDVDRQRYLDSVCVRSICRAAGVALDAQASPREARQLMRRHRLASVPVVSHGRVIGVFSMFAFLDDLLREKVDGSLHENTAVNRPSSVPFGLAA